MTLIEVFPPSFYFVLGALILLLFQNKKIRNLILLVTPIVAVWHIFSLPLGKLLEAELFGFQLELMRIDKLSRIFGVIFCLAAFLGNLYAAHLKDTIQQVASLLYSGAAIGAVFAGDLITLFIYWEATAIASVFLIWARGTEGAYYAGMRYLVIQIGSGLLLLCGVLFVFRETGSIEFNKMTLNSIGTLLIFLSFGVKCAFPLLHNWLQDSYPAATVTGTVILSAFTTKLAVYALARGFPGTEILIYIGAIMTLFPIFFAEIENDLRRVLAYSLNNQLGFMVVGIGIGTELSLNGTVSHAFAHILYKALLFMAVGAVLFRTGTCKASELGGIYRTMPRTAIFCLIGAASISAFPLFSGFVTKSLILDATAKEHYTVIWAALIFASAGVLSHSGIKIPYFTFFGQDSGLRPKEAPIHMQIAMGITAILCILIGVMPSILYPWLPYPVEFIPYTTNHVISQLQLLFFALLAFTVIMKLGLHPKDKRSINLDTDWVYRKLIPSMSKQIYVLTSPQLNKIINGLIFFKSIIVRNLVKFYGPGGHLSKIWPTGTMVLWVAILLLASLSLSFIT